MTKEEHIDFEYVENSLFYKQVSQVLSEEAFSVFSEHLSNPKGTIKYSAEIINKLLIEDYVSRKAKNFAWEHIQINDAVEKIAIVQSQNGILYDEVFTKLLEKEKYFPVFSITRNITKVNSILGKSLFKRVEDTAIFEEIIPGVFIFKDRSLERHISKYILFMIRNNIKDVEFIKEVLLFNTKYSISMDPMDSLAVAYDDDNSSNFFRIRLDHEEKVVGIISDVIKHSGYKKIWAELIKKNKFFKKLKISNGKLTLRNGKNISNKEFENYRHIISSLSVMDTALVSDRIDQIKLNKIKSSDDDFIRKIRENNDFNDLPDCIKERIYKTYEISKILEYEYLPNVSSKDAFELIRAKRKNFYESGIYELVVENPEKYLPTELALLFKLNEDIFETLKEWE